MNDRYSMTLSELLDIEFPELIWYVNRLLTPGLTLLFGFAKSGKSILMVGFALAVALGGRAIGQLEAQTAGVLIISLEDGMRRLQTRFMAAHAVPTENLHIYCKWDRGSKGLESLRDYLDDQPKIKVVFIDTLFLFSKLQDSNDYSQTTNLMEALKQIADERDICIVVLHHSKKTSKADNDTDFTQSALGSTGIVSGPDHLMYLKRTPSGATDAVLYYTSKDAPPSEIAINFDADIGGWKYAGEAQDIADSDERQAILDLLRAEAQAMSTGDIAEKLGKKSQAVSNLLQRLLKKEQVRKLGYGLYALPPDPPCKSCKCVTSDETYTVTQVTQGYDKHNSEHSRASPELQELPIF